MPHAALRRTLGTWRRLLACVGLLACAAVAPARAIDLLGGYVDGEFGEAQVQSDAAGITAGTFKKNHSAYQLGLGIKPIPLIGAELDYIDLGHPSGTLGGQPADVSIKGVAAFGLLYLPLPLPLLDIYAKAGLARLQSEINGTAVAGGLGTCPVGDPNCVFQGFHLSRSDSKFAAGLGAQLKFGDLAVRAEYERFDTAGGNPGLFALGLAYTFF
jgi:hypothetical protein